MSEHHSLLDSIKSFFVPVHSDGHKFLAVSAIATLLLFWLWSPLGWLAALVTAFVAYFFRDPVRVTPQRAGLVIAPADGRVTSIEDVAPPVELAMEADMCTRVSIFLSVFDVHINRAPISGEITRTAYVPGLFLNADLDKASEDNERKCYLIEADDDVAIGVVQIAGLIARRIVSFVEEGDAINAGERFGLIRFGSRVDLYLPRGTSVSVAVGQTAIGGETVIGDMKSSEDARAVRRM